MATAKYGLTYLDYDKETSTTKWNMAQLDPVSILTIGANLAILRAAVAGISGATLQSERFTQIDDTMSMVPPTNQYYQRETKWLVRYQDNVTMDVYRTEIPCANLSLLGGHSEFLDITTALSPGLVFKNAFEAQVVSEDGNPITVLDIQAIGRDL